MLIHDNLFDTSHPTEDTYPLGGTHDRVQGGVGNCGVGVSCAAPIFVVGGQDGLLAEDGLLCGRKVLTQLWRITRGGDLRAVART